MPHGYQWSHEELRNAERAAKIQAQAIVEAQRKERARQEREDRRKKVEESLRYQPSTSSSPKPRTSYQDPFRREIAQQQAAERVRTSIARMRAEKAMAAIVGSADYIHNRYGHAVWLGKVTEYRNKFSCSEEEAIILMVRDYKESEWAHLEDPLIEQFMGHRR